MNDLFRLKQLKVEQQLEKVTSDWRLCLEQKGLKIKELDINQGSTISFQNEQDELKYQKYLLTNKKSIIKGIVKEGLGRPILFLCFAILVALIKPFFPDSYVVADFIIAISGFSTLAFATHYGKNVFWGLKELKEHTHNHSLEEIQERERQVRRKIEEKQSEKERLEMELYHLDRKLIQEEELIAELKKLLQVIEGEQKKTIEKYLEISPEFKAYWKNEFLHNDHIQSYKRLLQLDNL